MLADICEVFIPGRQQEYIEGEEAVSNNWKSDYFNITPFKTALEQMKWELVYYRIYMPMHML